MKIISYNGYVFSTYSYYGAIEAGTSRGQWSILPQIRARHNAAGSLTGVQVSERVIPVTFGYTGASTYENAFLDLLGQLNPLNPYPRTLVAQMNDGTTVQCEAIVTTPGGTTFEDDVNMMRVVFVTTDPLWTDPTNKTASQSWGNTSTATFAPNNTGRAYAPATITFKYENKSPFSSNFNHFNVDIKNNTDLNWYRELVFINIGDTTSASGFAPNPAYCNVYLEGVQQSRTVVNYGTLRTYISIPATIAAGDTRTYEVVINKTDSDADRIENIYRMQSNSQFNGFYTPVYVDGATGTATAGASTTLTDSGASWRTVGGWAGGFVEIVSGTGAGQCRRISSNTATQITVARAWTTNPDNTSVYCIHTSGWLVDGGQASGGGASSLIDSSQTWDAGTLVGGTVTIISGTGSGQTRTITANTATQVSASFSPAINTTSVYVIRKHGYHQYNVDQTDTTSTGAGYTSTHRHGGWQLSSRATPPSRLAFGGDCVAGWRRITYADNRDDYNQIRWTSYVSGGATRYSGLLNATRRRGQDSRLREEGTGDGVAITSALAYQGIRFDYRHQNINAVGSFLLSVREAGSEDWSDVVTDSTSRATLTAVAVQYQSFTDYGNPTQIYMGIVGKDGAEIPTTQATTDQVAVQWYQTLRLYQNASAITITVGAKSSRLRARGEIVLPAGYGATLRVMYIGSSAGSDRELFMLDDNSTLLSIDSETGNVTLGSTSVPWAVKVEADGRLTSIWAILPPGSGTSMLLSDLPVHGTVGAIWDNRYYG
jgi:hypothetical protein